MTDQFKQYHLPDKIPTGIESFMSPYAAGVNLRQGVFQSGNYVKDKKGWQLDSDGNLYANSGTFRGDLSIGSGSDIIIADPDHATYRFWIGHATDPTLAPFAVEKDGTLHATGASIGGTITASSIHIPDQDTTANSFHVQTDADTWWGCTETNFNADNDNATAYVLKTGVAKFQNVAITGGTVGGQDVANVGYVATSTADAVPTGLSYSTGGISTGNDGSQSAYATLTWNTISTDTFDHYLIRYKKAALTYYTYVPANTNTITIEGLTPNISYNFGVASVNKYGAVSAYSANITQTTAADSTPPATVASDSATGGIQYIIVEWTHNTDSDLASYNIYRHTSNVSGSAVLIGNSRTNYFIDGEKTGGTTYYYWIKAVDTSGNVSASFSTVQSAAPRNVENTDVTIGIAAEKILIDGAVYLTNWRKTGDLTKIDGGSISTNTITTTQLNFTPVQSTDVIAKINASAEGITIEADNITIAGATTFTSGWAASSNAEADINALNTTNAPAAAGADVTGSNTAANIAGQGALATLNNVGASNCDTTIISGGKIITGLLTASNITTGTMNAARINGGEINGVTINGVTITGGTVQTSTSGQRVKLINDVIQFYNSGGTYKGSLYATSDGIAFDNTIVLLASSWTHHLEPIESNISDLGDSSYKYRHLLLDQNIYMDDNQYIYWGGDKYCRSDGTHFVINQHIAPSAASTYNLGTATNYWNEVNYKTLTDRGCLGWFDKGVELQDGRKVSDIEALQAIKKHPTLKTIYGVPRLDYKTFPKVSYKPVDIAKEDVYEYEGEEEFEDSREFIRDNKKVKEKFTNTRPKKVLRYKKNEKIGEDGVEMTSMFSIMIGALKELDNRLKKIE